MRLTADRKIIREHANGWSTNAVLVLTVLSAFDLSWDAAGDMMKELHR